LTLSEEVSAAIRMQHQAIYEAVMIRDGIAAKAAARNTFSTRCRC